MPERPMRPCGHPGCPVLVVRGRCAQHKRQVFREDRARRGTRTQRLYDNRWVKESTLFLRAHPLCMCPNCDSGKKRATIATVVDHDPPHEGDEERFWDTSTWRSMSKPCHDRKTAMFDGGFGHAKRPATS